MNKAKPPKSNAQPKSWNNAFAELRVKEATPPPGFQSIEEIVAETGFSEEKVRAHVKQLVKEGKADVHRGKKLTSTGTPLPTNYYKLIK